MHTAARRSGALTDKGKPVVRRGRKARDLGRPEIAQPPKEHTLTACPRGARRALALAIALAATAAAAPAAHAADAGSVNFAKAAESSFDRFTAAPSTGQQSWMRAHYSRMRTYAPYFDSRLNWFSNAWTYKDAYAIYTGEALATQHPEWILRDANGNKLYVQFACNGSSCTQYAADIGSPAWRADWIAKAKAQVAAGYRGLFVDDVNMEPRVSDGTGATTPAIDPRTGQPITLAVWQRYMAEFMEQIRVALPGVEIVHNALWYLGDGNSYLQRELKAADVIEIERGVNDTGITGGTWTYALRTFLSWVDRRHAEGHGVVLDGRADTAAGQLYGLAAYFLLSNGNDLIGNEKGGTPEDWWSGYDTKLGSPLGNRYDAGGVLRRDFTGGTVLVNEPGGATRSVSVGSGYKDLAGAKATSVTLAPASGAVLLREAAPTDTSVGTTPTPTPTPTPTATPTPTPPTATPSPTPSPTPTPTPRRPKPRHRAPKPTATTARASGVRVQGRVSGASTGRVKISVQRKRGSGWVTARRATATVAQAGTYSRDLARLASGSYRVRARFTGTGSALPSSSGYHKFTLSRRH
jgi:Hypothetical glycosyl hydrolase family 15